LVVQVKALACELPYERKLPFSRLSCRDLAREAVGCGLVASLSGTTVWRWLSADAIRPWSHRTWIAPRDPHFAERAAPVLDLYHGVWRGQPLGPDDYVLCADEKTGVQALRRQPGEPPAAQQRRRVESHYRREGTLAYLAAWDVHRAKLFGRCEPTVGLKPFADLVDEVMGQEPYRAARRVFWITDHGTSHRGPQAIARLAERHPRAHLIHTPIHASWLNQIEIYFSILQRKVLTPNETGDLEALADRLLAFQHHYQSIAQPFHWAFTRADLQRVLGRLTDQPAPSAPQPDSRPIRHRTYEVRH
jgi:hypothetical protein